MALFDLPYELLSYIMILLVQSPEGSETFARALCVSRRFRAFVEDPNILKVAVFHDPMLFQRFTMYQKIQCLVIKCAEAGNVGAQSFLAKIIMLSSYQLFLLERSSVFPASMPPNYLASLSRINPGRSKVGYFMAYFLPGDASTSRSRLLHHQLVNSFIRNCNPFELVEMGRVLEYYLKYFASRNSPVNLLLQTCEQMIMFANRIILISDLSALKVRLDDSFKLLREIGHQGTSTPSTRMNFDEAAVTCSSNLGQVLNLCEEIGLSWQGVLADEGAPIYKFFDEVTKQFEVARLRTIMLSEICIVQTSP